jgi:lysophospholipase
MKYGETMTATFRVTSPKTPDGRFLRVGVWDIPEGAASRGLCIVLQGLTEFLEKYEEVAEELVARGFTVASVDWRGQGASDKRVYGNRAAHVVSFDEYDLDLVTLINHVVLPTGAPVIALAHSMGAHILLRYLHEHRRRFACAVLTAPMLEIDTGKYSPAKTEAVALALNLLRPSGRPVFGTEDRDPMTLPFEDNRVTSDPVRYARTQALLRAQPFLRINGPTFAWLRAALRSMRILLRPGYAEEIATPLLIFGAGRDRVVHTGPIRDFVKHLPDARYVELEESEHEILMENDAIRAEFWTQFDAFVDARVPR